MQSTSCQHQILQLDVSPFAELAGYSQPTPQKRAAAQTTSGRVHKSIKSEPITTFPPPLVLPHDDLNYDPDCPPQSVNSWLKEKARNKLTDSSRNTLYVVQVPRIDKDVGFMSNWTIPEFVKDENAVHEDSPRADMLIDYLRAFYSGMNSEVFPTPLLWTTWNKSTQPHRRTNLPKYVGLSHQGQCTRVRVRNCPDGAFAAQLNLDDIIDAAISIMPQDAYALVVLVDHDLYETADDDFCCGRAYGGSRVAVVQTARYNPLLDAREAIDRSHMWPFSHCKRFVDDLCAVEELKPKKPTAQEMSLSRTGCMRSAVDAAVSLSTATNIGQDLAALWFSRLARTVSHELGHCFGIGHCIYYACNMQGTAGMKEDVRQPPYLCPVCEMKVAHAVVAELHQENETRKDAWIKNRNQMLIEFCEHVESSGMGSAMWRGLGAWSIERMRAMS